jgi:hypothetical protein
VKRFNPLFHVKSIIVDSIMQIVKEKLTNKEKNKETGKIGEDITENYLRKKGFAILGRNYLKKWGEIDIVARRTGKIHFDKGQLK